MTGLWRAWWSGGFVMISYASALHLLWAFVLLFFGYAAAGSTALSGLLLTVGGNRWVLIVALTFAAVGALLAVGRPPSMLGLSLMLPQQVLLLISTFAGLQAVFMGAYADGVVRPWPFILTDQLPIILAAPLYTVAVVLYHGGRLGHAR